MKPLLYLELRQLINSVKAAFKSPKRLVPAVIITAWMLAVVIQDIMAASGIGHPLLFAGPAIKLGLPIGPIRDTIFTLLTIASACFIYTALADGLLVFSPSHIDFLFATPVSHRHVLIFKLLRDYAKYALYAGLFFSVLGSPLYHLLSVPMYPELLLSWLGTVLLIIFVMNLTHTLNIVATAGIQRFRVAKLLVQLVVLALVVVILSTAVVAFAWTNDTLASARQAIHAVQFVLAPIAWATDIILVPLRGVVYEREELFWLFLLALGSTLLLLGRHEDIYEPSIGVSTRIARIRSAIRAGDVTTARIEAAGQKSKPSFFVLPIPPFGRGASSLLWKNLAVRVRTSSLSIAVIALAPVAVAAIVGGNVYEPNVRQMTPLALPYVAWILALMGQQELRSELRQANLIKSMPLSPFRAMVVQVVYEWLPVVLVVLTSGFGLWHFVPDVDGYVLGVSMALAIGFGFTCVSVISIPVLLYPDARDKMQDIIAHVLSFLLASVAILPSILVVALAKWFKLPLPAAILALLMVNAAISFLALTVVGNLYAKFDPTAE